MTWGSTVWPVLHRRWEWKVRLVNVLEISSTGEWPTPGVCTVHQFISKVSDSKAVLPDTPYLEYVR